MMKSSLLLVLSKGRVPKSYIERCEKAIEHQDERFGFLSILLSAVCSVALTATLAEGGAGVRVCASPVVNLHVVFRGLKCHCVVPS